MTDLRKAAEMALGALEEYTCVVQSGTDPNKWHEVVDGGAAARQAIEALRQALAQPEQEPVCAHGVGKTKCGFCKQPEQEPEWIEDGFGTMWQKCGKKDCGKFVVKIGKSDCWNGDCPEAKEKNT